MSVSKEVKRSFKDGAVQPLHEKEKVRLLGTDHSHSRTRDSSH